MLQRRCQPSHPGRRIVPGLRCPFAYARDKPGTGSGGVGGTAGSAIAASIARQSPHAPAALQARQLAEELMATPAGICRQSSGKVVLRLSTFADMRSQSGWMGIMTATGRGTRTKGHVRARRTSARLGGGPAHAAGGDLKEL
jgi:hypothetical protein